MIVLTLVGIIIVLSTWLFGSYKSRQELVVSDIERSLFNVIQTYYDDHEERFRETRARNNRQNDNRFISRIVELYPELNREKLSAVVDSLGRERRKTFERKRIRPTEKEEPTQIFPSFMLQNIEFNDTTLRQMNVLMDKVLKSKNISVPVNIELETLDSLPQHSSNVQTRTDEFGNLTTRPILVNSHNNEFLIAKIDDPSAYILVKMGWQLVLSTVLVFALVGSFIYLLWTINRQNKLAIMHKTFVNNMTHELKTPVATVMAAIEAVQRYGAKDDSVRMEKYLDLSRKELDHLSQMIERVLHFDMNGANGVKLEFTNFDVIKLINTCIETAKISLQKDVRFSLTSTFQPVFVDADEAHIKNVISNLIDNAIKYSVENVDIVISIVERNKDVEIRIRDNGLGIEPIYHKDIFDRFFRVPTGNLYSVKGFGLGLAYVKQVIEQHDGFIEVESALEKGTTFIISLPKSNI
ncbi:sensor histidine kinase [Sphingobacterium olei]|nr:HAMP domain-containing sensor histidine kinase [Sphingobacterium olei]